MTTGNRATRASCALAALTASLLALAVSCGGSGRQAPKPRSASQLVGRALGGRARVDSGQVDLSLSLLAPSAREVFVLHSATRFRVSAPGSAPAIAMRLAMLSRGRSGPPRATRMALASGPRGISLSIQGRPVRTNPQTQRALQAGYAQLAGARAGGGGELAAPLALDTAAWLSAPRYVTGSAERSTEDSAGAGQGSAAAVHVRGGLALGPFLADVGRIASLSAGLEQAAGRAGAGSLAAALSRAALRESGAGAVDLYVDRATERPRRLVVSVNLHSGTGAGGRSSQPLAVSLRMSFTALGEPAGPGST